MDVATNTVLQDIFPVNLDSAVSNFRLLYRSLLILLFFLSEINLWMVGESREPDVPGVETCTVKQILLDQCMHTDPALSLATLQLFEVRQRNQSQPCTKTRFIFNRSLSTDTSGRRK